MTSPSKKEWKNPNDIMKIHRIKRQSSGGITQKSKINISRRNSMSAFSDSVKTNGILASKSDSSISSSQKRKNPFSCDSHSSNKRRFSLQVGTTETVTDSEKVNTLVETSVCEDAEHPVGIETEKQVEYNHQHHVRSLSDLEEKDEISPPKKCESLKTKELMSDENIQNMQQDQHPSDYPSLITSPSPEEHSKLHPNPPLDWSLKSKLRVIVHSLESSYKKIPGIDAKHVDSFIHHNLDNDSSWNSLDVYQKLKRCCLYYTYPHMPWISTFPRMNTDFKSRSASLVSTSNEVLDAFQKDWANTFTSVYQQFRSGLCPYFYTCTHQFTVLFRCQRSTNNTSISAILSPSTRGLREMLNREGIGYRMPNIKTQKLKKTDKNSSKDDENLSQRCQQVDSKSDKENVEVNHTGTESDHISDPPEAKATDEQDDDSDDDFDIADHDGASRWLEGMGLNHKDFPSLKPFEVKLQREGYREIDNRPQSMLYVEGVDVHPFFNFLLNYPGCIASSGPQHGIPPTLLSPTPFVGSLLVQNNVKHSVLKDKKPLDSKLGTTHVFEIMGPLLPHHTLNVACTLHTSQEVISASVSHSTYLPSAALNTLAVNTEEKDKLASGLQKLFVDISYAYPGLLEGVKDRMTSPPQVENGMSVKEVAVSKSGFTWSCL